jgi:hypothetical protein
MTSLPGDLRLDGPAAWGAGSRLVRELVWRRIDVPGLEHFQLWDTAAGPRLAGTMILVQDGAPCRLKYAVACAPDWTSRGVHVALTQGAGTRHVKLTADDRQRWWRSVEEVPRTGDGSLRQAPPPAEVPEVAGCFDLDLAFTPATNVLPLRRLGLAAGESRETTAAWLRFPGLAVEPLPQRYTRLDERRVRYESRGGAFTAELEVDELGLVVRYPPLWERAALGEIPPVSL